MNSAAEGHFSADNIGDGSKRAAHAEPESFVFDQQSDGEIEAVLKKYPTGRQASGVLPLLYIAQAQMKRTTGSAWLPRVAMDAVAARLSMPPIRVYEVATFYLMFNTRPIGKYHLQVCTTTPCWLQGSDNVVAACRKVTGLTGWGETSADGLFTMTEVECLGACVNAPILQIDDDFYEDVNFEITERLLETLKRGEALPQPGSMIGRATSAPAGGPNTLTSVTE
jgi:NADH-quinone oxidoreductase subunit E